ncbi:hypothetical protein [uncultured Apibacter sp.]|nr:hypothetical protein [uncultured Apibacter sp.]
MKLLFFSEAQFKDVSYPGISIVYVSVERKSPDFVKNIYCLVTKLG